MFFKTRYFAPPDNFYGKLILIRLIVDVLEHLDEGLRLLLPLLVEDDGDVVVRGHDLVEHVVRDDLYRVVTGGLRHDPLHHLLAALKTAVIQIRNAIFKHNQSGELLNSIFQSFFLKL